MRDLLLVAFLVSSMPLIIYRYQVGALVICFLSLMYPQSNMYGFALSIEWIDYFFLLTFASYIIAQGFKKYEHHSLITYLGLFYVWVCLTSIFAYDSSASYEAWERFTKVLILAMMAYMMLNTKTMLFAFLKVMILSIGFYGVKGGVFTVLTGGSSHVLGPPDSFFSDNNNMSLVLVMTIPFMFFFIAHAENIYQRYFAIVCSLCSAFAVLGTQSRTGFVAFVASFLYFTMLQKKLGKAIMILAPIALVASYVMADTWASRMESTTDLETDTSFQSRVVMWKVSYEIGKDYPILGGGFDIAYQDEIVNRYLPGRDYVQAIHSAYFQMIAEHGFTGLILYIILLILLFRTSSRLCKESKGVVGFEFIPDLTFAIRSSLLGYLIIGINTNIAFFDILYFLIVILAIASVLLNKEKKKQEALNNPAAYMFR